VNPTEAAMAQAAYAADSRRWSRRVGRALSSGLLFVPNIVRRNDRCWAQGTIPEQGVSYVAANLFGKRYVAECHAGKRQSQRGNAIRVSANVAPIAYACSTAIGRARRLLPLLPAFGVFVADAPIARELMYLLLVDDLFGDADGANLLRGLRVRRVHGGTLTHPYALAATTRLAYVKSLFGHKR
jgi:hypothetical protein